MAPPQWSVRSRKAISDDGAIGPWRICTRHVPAPAGTQEPAAIHRLWLGRPRQVYSDRPAALRGGAAVRRPVGYARDRVPEAWDAGQGARFLTYPRRTHGRARTEDHDRHRLSVLLD